MVKLVYCIRRKQGLSRDEFRRYWAEVHGPSGRAFPAASHGFSSGVVCLHYERKRDD